MDVKSGVSRGVSFARRHYVLLILLAVLFLQFVPNGGKYPWGGIWMRMQVQELPLAENAAASSVENFVQQQAQAQARQQYPNLPDSNRQKVVNDLAVKFREERKDDLERERARLAQEIKDHYSYEHNDKKFLYMPDIDPYYYLRFARNIVEKGHVYDELKDGRPWDNHMLAPVGAPADNSWHPHVLALIYRVYSTFSDVSLMQAVNYFPIILILLSMVFAFLIGWRVSGVTGGFFAATMVALSPSIMGRTPWGHADTDAYNILMPLLITWLLIEALRAHSWKRQVLFGSLVGVFIVVYMKLWGPAWYFFNFIGGAILIGLLAQLAAHRKSLFKPKELWHASGVRKLVNIGVSILAASSLLSVFTIGLVSFWKTSLTAAIQATALKVASQPDLWPNTLTTVAELNPGSLSHVMGSVGGKLLFAFGVLGILLILLRKEDGRRDATIAALLVIWFIGTSYMVLKGVRFIVLFGPAFAIAFGCASGLLYNILSGFCQRQLNVDKRIVGVVVFIAIGLLIINPVGGQIVKQSYGNVVNDVPIMNDAWWNALDKINKESAPNAIVNSWWDFGHHFKYVADRAVTFDGASQTVPQVHWIGRALQTNNEDEAVAILRMLDCGANSAFEEVNKVKKDTLMSVKLVKEIIMLDRNSAASRLNEEGLPESILEFTHCDAPEDYFIASADMIGKSGVWVHFGTWSFEKAEVWQKWRKESESVAVPQMVERFGVSEDEAEQLYRDANALSGEDAANSWIGPWAGYITADVSDCGLAGNIVTCGPVTINASSQRATISANQGVAEAGKLVMYAQNGSKAVFENKDGNSNFAVVAWPTRNGLRALPAYTQVADSMFTRLYYMNGLGLKHFKLFTLQNQLIGGNIFVWKVDWAGEEVLVPDELKPKEKVEAGAEVVLNYIGWTDDGVFDSSIVDWQEKNVTSESSFGSDTRPLAVRLGEGKLIPGFESRIMGMKAGESKTITVPPEEAYGVDPEAHALGNKTLHFRIRVEAVR